MEWSEEIAGVLLRAAPEAILVLDGARVVQANNRAVELYGHDPAGLFVETAAITAVRRPDGSEIAVEASSAEVDTARGPVTVVVLRDLTARTRAENARRLESLGQLAGGIAHDFNNMLGVIVNYANFVVEEAESAEPDASMMAADARQVIKAGERGTALTHRLLAFARREVVRPQVLDLNRLLDGVAERVSAAVGDGVTLLVRPGPDVPPVVCDPAQIEQVLVNLALNARDAMPSGGNLVIDTSRHDDQVRLRVCDSGRGMTPEVAGRAFEPFFTTRTGGPGSGLGLATVHGIVTQAGGEVSIASEPGLGTTVTVLLPAAPPSSIAASATEPAATVGHGETLLVVEDEAALRDVAGRILSGAGYHVLAAEGGVEALALAARHDGAIDLLLSDVVMPGMLGKDLVERFVVVRPDTRVLYMSGYAQPILHSQGTLDPGVALLEKPFTADDLLTAVRKRLDG